MKTVLACLSALVIVGCGNVSESATSTGAVSSSGVHETTVAVPTGSDNLTAEQRNVRDRYLADNKPGSIKHLYVISAYSGQVIVYSTVKGKVTSSGKRLSPHTVSRVGGGGQYNWSESYYPERLEDDGTYGQSVPYIYWWDTKGVYHQHYVDGGQILHISSEPLAVKGIVINMELR